MFIQYLVYHIIKRKLNFNIHQDPNILNPI